MHTHRSTPSFVRVYIGDRRIRHKLNLDEPIVVIIHGWFDSYDRTWINGTTRMMQKVMKVNVCTLDWERLSSVEYSVAANNTRIVAKELTQFLQFLHVNGNVHFDNVTLVGHSFGGQIAGYAGASLGGRIGRIFGLDPAGWSFTKPSIVEPLHRLDKTDAKYVQCIHTNGNLIGLGSHFDCGHQDFYPNNGVAPQPGCVNPREEGGPTLCKHMFV